MMKRLMMGFSLLLVLVASSQAFPRKVLFEDFFAYW